MQTLTLASKEFDVAETREIAGVLVPWEVKSYVDDFDVAESTGGFFDLSHWDVIEISGPDATDYLNRMTTVNFLSFPAEKIVHGAFLNGRGGVITLGFFQKMGKAESPVYHFCLPPGHGAIAVEHIEKFHFGEKLTVENTSAEWAFFGLWKPFVDLKQDLEFPAEGTTALKVEFRRWKSVSFDFWQDGRLPDLFWTKIPRKEATIFCVQMKKLGVALLGQHLFEYYRLRAGIPTVGNELSEKDIILEANFDECVARNKGCYPGQEVVERIFTYGSVNRKLMRVEIDRDEAVDFPKVPVKLAAPEKDDAGLLMSYQADPEDPQRAFGLAYIQKNFWAYEEDFDGGDGVVVRITDVHENSAI